MTELENNCAFVMNKSNAECFIEQLYEKNIFDTRLLKELFNDLVKIIKPHPKRRTINELENLLIFQWQLFEIFRIMLYTLEGHHNPMCIDKIENLDPDYHIYVLRFEFLVKCFVFKDYQALLDYEDDLGKLIP